MFFKDNTWQVVPNSWLVTKDGRQCVFWPDTGNVTDLAKENARVKRSWTLLNNIKMATTAGQAIFF